MKRGKKKLPGNIDNNIILTEWQKIFLRHFICSELREVYRLSGGTALSAFYLEHRLSDDLDFFADQKIPVYLIEDFLKKLDFVKKIDFTKKYDRNIFILSLSDNSTLKTEFTYYPLKNLEPVNVIDSLPVDSFKDIVVNKFCAIADRIEIKDYSDIYCAIQAKPSVSDKLLKAVEDKCEIKGIHYVLESRLLQIPKGIEHIGFKVNITLQDMEECFSKLVRKIIRQRLAKEKDIG